MAIFRHQCDPKLMLDNILLHNDCEALVDNGNSRITTSPHSHCQALCCQALVSASDGVGSWALFDWTMYLGHEV